MSLAISIVFQKIRMKILHYHKHSEKRYLGRFGDSLLLHFLQCFIQCYPSFHVERIDCLKLSFLIRIINYAMTLSHDVIIQYMFLFSLSWYKNLPLYSNFWVAVLAGVIMDVGACLCLPTVTTLFYVNCYSIRPLFIHSCLDSPIYWCAIALSY